MMLPRRLDHLVVLSNGDRFPILGEGLEKLGGRVAHHEFQDDSGRGLSMREPPGPIPRPNPSTASQGLAPWLPSVLDGLFGSAVHVGMTVLTTQRRQPLPLRRVLPGSAPWAVRHG